MEGDEVELDALRKRYSRQQLEEANVEEIPFSELMAMEVLSQADILGFQEKGFLVVKDVLTEPQCRIIERRMVEVTMNLSLFAAEDFKLIEGDTYSVLINSHDQLALLRNPHCTKKLLNDNKTRRPHVSKVHGHWNLYWLPEMQTIVNSNPKIYTVHRQLYGKYQLRSSLNTIGLKPPTSLDMPALAFDAPLYEDTSHTNECLERSIKSIVCLRSPNDVEPRDSGTFELVESFHLYFELAAAFLDPETGYPDCRLPVEDPLGRAIAHLDLPALNLYIRMYTFIQRFNVRPNTPVPSMTSTAQELWPFATTSSSSSSSSLSLSPSSASAASAIPAGDAAWTQHAEMWSHALQTYHGSARRIGVPEVARQLRWTVPAGPRRPHAVPHPAQPVGAGAFLYAYCTMSKITNEALYYGSDDWKTLGKCNRNIQGAHKDSKSFNELELELFEKHYHKGYSRLYTYGTSSFALRLLFTQLQLTLVVSGLYGVYNHFRQDNLLSKALWGWDFRKPAMFKWSAYAEPGAADLPKRSQGSSTAACDVPSPDPLCSWESSPPPSGTVSATMATSSPIGTKRPRGDAADAKPAKRLAKRTTKRSAKAKATAESAGSPLLFESQPSAGASEWRAPARTMVGA
ncbi:uncharacterized protein ACA1_112090 [Acanthamoeba castellanii str. Neff]|uniref:Uncharacterized protein n=1 Tax=Acanthamoeba castellanii (strain ATCC 30010 / Neff) TaxID=1257118 RepID=L8H627_ACACF|nr:uncharacterized protein ACA1_112090 [Acanthamoeba castellanii str. Neff]ELR19936.1 hypothetical protein ACA1_112090 [Acanthamoeba castellanii str. Neff]